MTSETGALGAGRDAGKVGAGPFLGYICMLDNELGENDILPCLLHP